jgi:hypothetical protein
MVDHRPEQDDRWAKLVSLAVPEMRLRGADAESRYPDDGLVFDLPGHTATRTNRDVIEDRKKDFGSKTEDDFSPSRTKSATQPASREKRAPGQPWAPPGTPTTAHKAQEGARDDREQ